MSSISPFTPDRYEYEPSHLYYIPSGPFNLLEGQSQVYIVGSRGTGKTTLMKAIYWEERLENEMLQRALGGTLFDKKYLGTYIKIPSILVDGFEHWSRSLPEDVVSRLFGLFVDLAWVDSIFMGASELGRRKILKAKPSREHKFVDHLVEDHPELAEFLPATGPYSLVTVARAVRSMRSRFERYINCRLDPNEILADFRVSQVGSFGRSMASKLASYCDSASQGGGKWYFKVCLDEAECLSSLQQKVLNTMIRLAQWPLFYVVSFVSQIGEFSRTVIPKLTVQKADREFLMLDKMSDADFKTFSEGVASVRISNVLDRECCLNLSHVLGNLNINRLLQNILKESEDPLAKDLLQRARELKKKLSAPAGIVHETEDARLQEETGEDLPIYQAYLHQKLNLSLPKPEDPSWRRRSQQSREIRKRMVAAYLSICSELGQEVRYASADMVLQISDKCIRDLLLQLHCILLETGNDLESMVRVGVSVSRQNRGIRRASQEKVTNLPKSGVTAPAEVSKIVEGLARVTARIQREEGGRRALLSSERGVFLLDVLALSVESPLLEILREASEAGYLKMLSQDDKKWRFRVHCSLAAAYGFSYRGAYYDVSVGVSELEKLRVAEGRESLERAINSIVDRVLGNSQPSPGLFDGAI